MPSNQAHCAPSNIHHDRQHIEAGSNCCRTIFWWQRLVDNQLRAAINHVLLAVNQNLNTSVIRPTRYQVDKRTRAARIGIIEVLRLKNKLNTFSISLVLRDSIVMFRQAYRHRLNHEKGSSASATTMIGTKRSL